MSARLLSMLGTQSDGPIPDGLAPDYPDRLLHLELIEFAGGGCSWTYSAGRAHQQNIIFRARRGGQFLKL